jgi:hypothetical protein
MVDGVDGPTGGDGDNDGRADPGSGDGDSIDGDSVDRDSVDGQFVDRRGRRITIHYSGAVDHPVVVPRTQWTEGEESDPPPPLLEAQPSIYTVEGQIAQRGAFFRSVKTQRDNPKRSIRWMSRMLYVLVVFGIVATVAGIVGLTR